MYPYDYYWWIREQYAKCDLLSSSSEKEICKASVIAQASRIGFTENVLLMQAIREPTVVQAESSALPIVAVIVVGAMLLSKK